MKTYNVTFRYSLQYFPHHGGAWGNNLVEVRCRRERVALWSPVSGWQWCPRAAGYDILTDDHIDHLTTLARQVWDEANGGSGA